MIVHFDSGLLHTVVQATLFTTLGGAIVRPHLCERHRLKLCIIWGGPVSILAKLLIPGIFRCILSFIIPNTISKFWVAICPYVLSELFVPDVAFQRRTLKLPSTLRGNSVTKAAGNPSSSPGNFIRQAYTHLLKSFPLQTSWTKRCPLTVRISYSYWRKVL